MHTLNILCRKNYFITFINPRFPDNVGYGKEEIDSFLSVVEICSESFHENVEHAKGSKVGLFSVNFMFNNSSFLFDDTIV